MKTVITGGTGFIGSHLAKKLAENGRRVIVTSNSPPDDEKDLADVETKIERCRVDLRNYHDALAVIEGADSVFHLAARVGNLTYLHGTQSAELVALQSNLSIDTNIFRACLETGVKRIVYTSSCAVYSLNKQLTYYTIFTEKEIEFSQSLKTGFNLGIVNPDGGYGWSKLLGELQLHWIKGIKISVARPFNIYGENECIDENAHVVGDLIRRVIGNSGEDFIVYGDGKQTRDFLHVSDCVNALLMLEEKASNPPLTINLGAGEAVSISNLAQKLIKISGKKLNLVFDTSKPVGPISRTADINKAKTLLGWAPAVSLDEGLRRTYAWVESKLKDRSV